MTVTFFSNFLNHHQTPFCDELIKTRNIEFTFVSTIETPKEFLDGGYENFSNSNYNLKSYENELNFQNAIKLGLDSDIVIIGSAPDVFIKERLKANKITFRYSERWFKQGDYQVLSPRGWWYVFQKHTIYRNKNLYMLCASAFTANDVSTYFAYPNKCFKWGYFPKFEKIDIEKILINKRQKTLKLLWVARWIEFKHPEIVIQMAFELLKKGYDFHIEMAGVGPLQADLKDKIKEYKLQDHITLLGVLKNDDILYKMQEANVFLFTSDRGEGWGAVVNEAMSNGCAVIGGHEIGCVPYLIENGVNGLIFKSKQPTSLIMEVEKLLKNRDLIEQLAKNAYHNVSNIWNAKNAANNFLVLANSLLIGKEINISEGPCSRALPTCSKFSKS